MHTTASPTANTNLTKMLSLFRKSKSSSASTVMANANTSETTLVSAPAKTGKGQRKPKYETEPYQAEFTGLSTLGGMPSLGGHFFVEPPKAKKTVVKMVPAQPFKASPRASFVEDRLSTVQERDSFETLSTSVASSTSSSGSGHPTSYQRKLLKQHKAFFNNSFANT